MATRIICPACGTRYETKAVFPPEGRKVRCSKCTHVWQALPVTAEPGLAAMPTEAAVAAVRPQSPPPAEAPAPAAEKSGGIFARLARRSPAPSAPPAPPAPPAPSIDAGLADAD